MRIERFVRYMLAYVLAIALTAVAAPVRILCGVYKVLTEVCMAFPRAVIAAAEDVADDMEPDD